MIDKSTLTQYNSILQRYNRLILDSETRLMALKKEYQDYIIDRNKYVAETISKKLDKPIDTFPVHSFKRNKGVDHITLYSINGGTLELNGKNAFCYIDNNGYINYRERNFNIQALEFGEIEYNAQNGAFDIIIGYSDLVMQDEAVKEEHPDKMEEKENVSESSAEE